MLSGMSANDAHPVSIRAATPADAAAFLALFRQVCGETRFMAFGPDEITRTTEEQAAVFARTDANSGAMLLAVEGETLVGFAGLQRSPGRRWSHTLYLYMGVVASAAGRGIGRRLLEAAETWGAARDIARIELVVMADNERAIRLYERCGFEREGVRRRAARIDGRWVDTIGMAKLIGS